MHTSTWRIAEPSAPTPRTYWVIPGAFLAGAYPGQADPAAHDARVRAIWAAGVRTVISAMEEHERPGGGGRFTPYLPTFEALAVRTGEPFRCLRFPIPDLGVTSPEVMRSILDAIDLSLDAKRPVYVHCYGGIGRTGTIVACWLIRHGLATQGQALEVLGRLRQADVERATRRSPETDPQRAMVRAWAEPPRRVASACRNARQAADAWTDGKPPARAAARAPARWLAVGDPQTTPERFFTVLGRVGLLGDDGWLDPDVGLISMGDHFDFKDDHLTTEPDRRAVLAWLAAHPAEQVRILIGNHDVARVAELAFESDGSFAAARHLAAAISSARKAKGDAKPLEDLFHRTFPRIPTPEIAERDYSAFSEAQRRMVQELLMSRRMRLATTARLRGVTALLTHAAVTTRELELLGVEGEPDATRIADALNRHLDGAVEKVTDDWRAGRPAALDLDVVHVAGTTGVEGGGLLYHRPADPDRPRADRQWELGQDAGGSDRPAPRAPRRYPPSKLPPGLLQVAGHSGHRKCSEELHGWVDPDARSMVHAPIRTLRAGPGEASYVLGVAPALPDASLVLIDPGLSTAPLDSIELLALDDDTR
jgi:hypothetical protein